MRQACDDAAGYPEPDVWVEGAITADVTYKQHKTKDRAFVAKEYRGCSRGPSPKRGSELTHACVVRIDFNVSMLVDILSVRDNRALYYGVRLPVYPERSSVLVCFHHISVQRAAPLLDGNVLWVPQPKSVRAVDPYGSFVVSVRYFRENWNTRISRTSS